MRIISGARRGKKLIPPKDDRVRPTTDRVKEALFDIIQFEVPGKVFLDLFAGSGQVGLEAVSRGAKQAVFVDSSAESLDLVKKNLALTEFGSSAQVVKSDFSDFLHRTAMTFDIAFLDPPYELGLLQKALPVLAGRMADDGVIICEHPKGETLPESAGRFTITKTYTYGKTALTFYRMAAED